MSAKTIKENKMSPFKLMMQTFAYGILATAAFTCYLFVTSHDWAHYVATAIIGSLMLLISFLISFYRACKYQVRRELSWRTSGRQAIHYPMHNQFKIQMVYMDQQARKYRHRGY
jgi:apolipoprotein N-acyltransferase